MKTPDGLFSLAGSIVILAIITTLVLPKRKTAQVTRAGGGVFIRSLKAAMGR